MRFRTMRCKHAFRSRLSGSATQADHPRPAPSRAFLAPFALSLAAGLAACGGGGNGGDPGDPAADSEWVRWNDNANGTVIKDASNDSFEVSVADRTLVFSRQTRIAGLIVDSSGNVLQAGAVRARLVRSTTTGGATIAVIQCVDGRFADVIVNGVSWEWNCGAGSTGSTGSSGTTSTGSAPTASSGTGTSGSTTAPSTTPVAGSTTYINWTGSANGDIVLDANDERFKFNAATRCMYSLQRDEETSNFCLSANSAQGSFAGRSVSVNRIRATDGTCITGMVDVATGRAIDIATVNGIQQVSVSSRTWTGC